MNHPKEWNEEEDNFDLTLSQRTEELYRIPNREPDAEGTIQAAVLPLRDLIIFPRMVSPIFVGREASPQPANPYGLAKDTLRRYLEFLHKRLPFILQCVRLFYIHGVGQNPNSLIAQLDRAIDNGDSVFNLSGGEQLRDYLPIEVVAHRLAWLAEHSECQGIINFCSGKPISVRRLVEKRIKQRGANITLNLGYYPYSDYEPMAFWGDGTKLIKCMGKRDETESI